MDSYVNVTGTVSGGVTTFDVESQNPTLKLKDVVFTRQQILLNDDGSPLTVTVNSSGDAIVTGSYPVQYKIGIPFTAWLIPNRVEIQLQDGSAQMRKWRITRAAFRVWQSLYGNINQYITYPVGQGATADFSNYTAIQYDGMSRFPYYPTYGSTINSFVYTGQTLPQALNFDWGNALDIVIASRHPAPFNILSTILEVEVEGTSGAGA